MKVFSYFIVVLGLWFLPQSYSLAEEYTIYLVRHAEKQKESDDPKLTRCGNFRANQLAEMLKNVELEKVYSTQYLRTMSTATPTAVKQGLSIKQYAPSSLHQLARQIKQDKKSVLVVGHSNTTPELLKTLTGLDIGKISESEYQHLFQVHVVNDKMTLTKLTQPLDCTRYE